jgi:hypothetical protein
MPFSARSSWRTTSAFPACRRNRSATQSSNPANARGRRPPRYGTQPPSKTYRRTVMWLQPSSFAIRLMPHPSAFSRSIAATSSGVCITSLRGNSPRHRGCTDSSIIRPSSISERVQFLLSPGVQFYPSPDTGDAVLAPAELDTIGTSCAVWKNRASCSPQPLANT